MLHRMSHLQNEATQMVILKEGALQIKRYGVVLSLFSFLKVDRECVYVKSKRFLNGELLRNIKVFHCIEKELKDFLVVDIYFVLRATEHSQGCYTLDAIHVVNLVVI